MQTLQFTRALRTMVEKLKTDKLMELLKPFLVVGSAIQIDPSTKDTFAALLFDSRTGYTQLAEEPSTAKVLQSLELDEVYETSRLGRLLSLFGQFQTTQNLWSNAQYYADFYSFFNQLVNVGRLRSACIDLLEREKLGQVTDAEELLEIQLIDYDGTGIDEVRVSQFISSLSKLHSAFARMLNISNDRLKFVYFDSGSDLIAAIRSAPTIVKSMSDLLWQWWDKIKFGRYDEFDKKSDALLKGFTVMETVQNAVSQKVIDSETGELLKMQVLIELGKLTGIGATLPFSEQEYNVDERALLIERRDAKLLQSGAEDGEGKTEL
jgi:hypothetical protein